MLSSIIYSVFSARLLVIVANVDVCIVVSDYLQKQ